MTVFTSDAAHIETLNLITRGATAQRADERSKREAEFKERVNRLLEPKHEPASVDVISRAVCLPARSRPVEGRSGGRQAAAMITCGAPGILLGTDDAEWLIANGEVVVTRIDGRMVTKPLRGECPCCLARWLYEQSTEMRKQ